MPVKIRKYTRLSSAAPLCVPSWFVVMLPFKTKRFNMFVMLTSQEESTIKYCSTFVVAGSTWLVHNLWHMLDLETF